MTIKSVEDHDSEHWELIDLDTGTPIDRVLWADDDAGYYVSQEKRDEGWVKVLHRGNIKLEDQRERYDPPLELEELSTALEQARAIVSYLEEQVALLKLSIAIRKITEIIESNP